MPTSSAFGMAERAGLGDDLLQHRGRDLAAAAAAVAELREAERGTFGCVHRGPGFVAAGSGPPQFPATAGARQPAFYRSRARDGRDSRDTHCARPFAPSAAVGAIHPYRDVVLPDGEGGKG